MGKKKPEQSLSVPKPRCYESHPALELPGGRKIYGGNCGSPKVKDADVYIGFDSSSHRSGKQFPWHPGYSFLFRIHDQDIPGDHAEFLNLLKWTADRLNEGMKVHAGCIGGHGRTGLFFAALVKHMGGTDDAVVYVRENYCSKAVESSKQMTYLHEKFGIKKAKITPRYSGAQYKGGWDYPDWGSKFPGNQNGKSKAAAKTGFLTETTGEPVPLNAGSIWRPHK